MSENKQETAIDWLREQFHKVPASQFGNLFEQAKAIHKEQMKKVFEDSQEIEYQYHINSKQREDFETYYTQTFKP